MFLSVKELLSKGLKILNIPNLLLKTSENKSGIAF
jgi:hypothetical protein